jgi:hypothetical protein
MHHLHAAHVFHPRMLPCTHPNHMLFAGHLLRMLCQTHAPVQMHDDMSSHCRNLSVLSRHDAGGNDAASVSGDASSVSSVCDETSSTKSGYTVHTPGRTALVRVSSLDVCPLNVSCVLAEALAGWTVSRDMIALGARLFQRLVRDEYLGLDHELVAPFFSPNGGSGPIACGAPDGVLMTDRVFLTYLTCIILAAKAHVSRGGEVSVGRRVRMALRTLGATRLQADAIWDIAIGKEYDILEALDWRVIELYQPPPEDPAASPDSPAN